MSNKGYTRTKNKAEELLKKYKIEEPIVPIFDIPEQEEVKINFIKMPDKLRDISGFFDPKKKIIFVNTQDCPNRQTFTVAHEFGHYILKHNPNKYGVLPRWAGILGSSPVEREANFFAANLLVPDEMLKKAMDKYALDNSEVSIALLAKMFGVSREVIKIRIKELGL
ncbi:hypothetical protein COY23_04550 [bacterium (Candidatus Torokbacteria) CG_4_10_14_0_2_um_filter_35_8]|nr:MAG: hypothetical protein COY23_04550 [bacterium (Candidatus Torokbacteria) CG_4_10_14_0_2_um_filter_35_8]